MTPNLFSDLCRLYGTDKSKYAKAYTSLFSDLRDTFKSVLELGIFAGGSLRLWHEFFPNANILGLDCNLPYTKFPARIRMKQGRQEDSKILQHLKEQGPYDLIIDDAGHQFEEQVKSYDFLHQETQFYLIEDVTFLDTEKWRSKQKPSQEFLSNATPEHLLVWQH